MQGRRQCRVLAITCTVTCNRIRNTLSESLITVLLRTIFALVAMTVGVLVIASSQAPSVGAEQTQANARRRLFENRVPVHLPIQVRIRPTKEELFRDLANDNWARDLELEVKNTGDKPIYALFFDLLVPDAKIGDSYESMDFSYGRAAIVNGETPKADDLPIKPGSTVVLKVDENTLKGWDEARQAGLVPSPIRGVRLIFQDLVFGDGTGFEGVTGTPRHKP